MARSSAEDKAIKKYLAKFDEIRFRVPQGEKEQIAAHAKKTGESLNRFLRRAVAETMARDNEKAD